LLGGGGSAGAAVALGGLAVAAAAALLAAALQLVWLRWRGGDSPEEEEVSICFLSDYGFEK
jgi:hypothetical protein